MNNKIYIYISCFVILLFIVGIVYNINRINRENSNIDTSMINKDAKLEDVVIDDNKINMYFFWGDGCSHCEKLFKFLNTISGEYSKYVNVYAFEVWNNEENAKLMDEFNKALDLDTPSGSVPFFIIGDKAFSGYKAESNDIIKETIIDKYNNRENINKFEDIIKKS